jgi:hypothetical protein
MLTNNQPELNQENNMQICGSFPTVPPPLLTPIDFNMMDQPNQEQTITKE